MIRRATAADVGVLAALYDRSFRTLDFLPQLHTLDEHREFLGRLVREHETYVYDDGGIVGFASLHGDVLTHLYVEPDSFGRGIGSALYENVASARPGGFTFWVFQQNERARRFYERRGARPIRFTDGSGNEERSPDVLYASA